MTNNVNVSVAGPEKAKFAAVAPGQERFAFLYVVIFAAALATVMTYSGLAGLSWWKSVLMLIGTVIVGWAILFSVLEVRRLGKSEKDVAAEREADVNPYTSREVVVKGPTNDPYPHHEDYVESQGFDQGQLTSRIPDTTPLVDKFLKREPVNK